MFCNVPLCVRMCSMQATSQSLLHRTSLGGAGGSSLRLDTAADEQQRRRHQGQCCGHVMSCGSHVISCCSHVTLCCSATRSSGWVSTFTRRSASCWRRRSRNVFSRRRRRSSTSSWRNSSTKSNVSHVFVVARRQSQTSVTCLL